MFQKTRARSQGEWFSLFVKVVGGVDFFFFMCTRTCVCVCIGRLSRPTC